MVSQSVHHGFADTSDRDSADPHRGRGPAVAADAASDHDALLAGDCVAAALLLILLLATALPARERRQPP